MARTTKNDWLLAGLRLLQEGGEPAVTIERTAAALGRTKGSFYHHFDDIDAYHAALLAHWEELHTNLPIRQADTATSSKGRRIALLESLRTIDIDLEIAVQAWAAWSPRARAACDRVHARRVTYLASLHHDADARDRAELAYATFLGSLQLHPRSPQRRAALQRRLGAK